MDSLKYENESLKKRVLQLERKLEQNNIANESISTKEAANATLKSTAEMPQLQMAPHPRPQIASPFISPNDSHFTTPAPKSLLGRSFLSSAASRKPISETEPRAFLENNWMESSEINPSSGFQFPPVPTIRSKINPNS